MSAFVKTLCVLTCISIISLMSTAEAVHATPQNYRSGCPPLADQAQGVPSVYDPPAESKGLKHFSQYIESFDGTKIAVEVYLPSNWKAGTKLPCIVEQTRYWRAFQFKFPYSAMKIKPFGYFRYDFVTHGYAWLVADVRGTGASFGSRPWEFSPLEIDDGKKILDWVTKQVWSNGKLGTCGFSYMGNTAEFALVNKQPAVKAAAVASCTFDLYSQILAPGGIIFKSFIDDWGQACSDLDKGDLPSGLRRYKKAILGCLPVDCAEKSASASQVLKQAIEAHQKNYAISILKDVRYRDEFPFSKGDGNPAFAGDSYVRSLGRLEKRFGPDYLKRGVDLASPSTYIGDFNQSEVPVYCVAGLGDAAYAQGAIDRYMSYKTPDCKLLLGPWDHNMVNQSPFSQSGKSEFDLSGELMKFFDFYLKDKDTGLKEDKPVHYFTYGKESWQAADQWPPINQPTSFALSKMTGNGKSDTLKVDFQSGAGGDTRWDSMLGHRLYAPYPDRAERDQRLLAYTSSALEKDMEITGDAKVSLILSVNAPPNFKAEDATVFVYLEDVFPDGQVRYISEGALCLAHRFAQKPPADYKTSSIYRSFARADAVPLANNEVTGAVISFQPVSYLLKKGHAVRLSIAGADQDHFKSRLPESGDLFITVYRQKERDSSIVLPAVVEKKSKITE